jgi:hypothetical protein
MVTAPVRGHCTRWILLVVLRTVVSMPAERSLGKRVLYAFSIASLFVVAYVGWLLTGRGPWRWLGLNAVPITPRGLPDEAFWLARAERIEPPLDVA